MYFSSYHIDIFCQWSLRYINSIKRCSTTFWLEMKCWSLSHRENQYCFPLRFSPILVNKCGKIILSSPFWIEGWWCQHTFTKTGGNFWKQYLFSWSETSMLYFEPNICRQSRVPLKFCETNIWKYEDDSTGRKCLLYKIWMVVLFHLYILVDKLFQVFSAVQIDPCMKTPDSGNTYLHL